MTIARKPPSGIRFEPDATPNLILPRAEVENHSYVDDYMRRGMKQPDTDALAKDLAIKLAVRELEKLSAREFSDGNPFVLEVIKNLLIGLGCEAVVNAWNEVG
jgi:hypothetical protein